MQRCRGRLAAAAQGSCVPCQIGETPLARELLVGLNIVDETGYARYREGIAPILEKYGGGFRYDFRIDETLKAATEAPINRLFTIYFADQAALDGFFTDAEYQKVRGEHFEAAVDAMTVIAAYDVEI